MMLKATWWLNRKKKNATVAVLHSTKPRMYMILWAKHEHSVAKRNKKKATVLQSTKSHI
jgi:hypothetical protein